MSVYHYLSQFAVIKGLALNKKNGFFWIKIASVDYPTVHCMASNETITITVF